ncbi:MAG TPA: hypothetical protein VGE76_19590 [Opitutaceae bacterium]
MIRSLRAYFLSRALREKLLLLAFVGIGFLWWFSSYGKRAGAFYRDQQRTSFNLKDQALWINNKASIEKNAETAAGKLDPSKTLNSNQLATTVQQVANEIGLKNAQLSGTPATRQSGQFAIHSVSYTVRNASYLSLREFYGALQQRAPYISIDVFTLQAAPNQAPGQDSLSLNIRAESVQIVR